MDYYAGAARHASTSCLGRQATSVSCGRLSPAAGTTQSGLRRRKGRRGRRWIELRWVVLELTSPALDLLSGMTSGWSPALSFGDMT